MKSFIFTLVCLLGLATPVYAQQEVDATALLFWAGGSPRCEGRVGSGAPSGGNTCDFYLDYSTGRMYTKIGSTWTLVGNISGTLTATRVPFADSATSLTDDADMTFATDTLSITKVNSPSVRSNYTSGFTGSGYTVDYGITTAGLSTVEADALTVRGIFSVYELLVHQIRATNGSVFVSSTGEISSVTSLGSSTYALETNTAHGFAVDDLIRAQRFTGSSIYQSSLEVTAVADTTHFTATLAGGSTVPEVGFEFVRIGNITDTSRQGSIYLTADDTNAPYINVIDGVSTFAGWDTSAKTKVRVGQLNGACSYVASAYGLCAGDGAGTFVSMDSTNGFRIVSGGLTKVSVTTAGVATFVGVVASGATIGGFDIGSDYIRDVANTFGFASTVSGSDDVRFWAGDTFANRAIAPTRITEAGVATFTAGAVGGWTINSASVSATNAILASNSGAGYVSFGATPPTTYGNNVGAWLGYSSGAKFSLYADVTHYFKWTGSEIDMQTEALAISSAGILITPDSGLADSAYAYRFSHASGGKIGVYPNTDTTNLFTELRATTVGNPAINATSRIFASTGIEGAEISVNVVSGTSSNINMSADTAAMSAPGGWTFTGSLLFFADATYDIGASGATRPRNLYLSGSVTAAKLTISGTTNSIGPREVTNYPLRIQAAAGDDVGIEFYRSSATEWVIQSYNRAGDVITALQSNAASYTWDISSVEKMSLSSAGLLTASAISVEGTSTLVGNGASGAGDVFLCITTADVVTQGATCLASAREFKTHIKPFTGGLKTALALKPSSFDWRYDKSPDLGFIADEVAAVDPRLGIWQNDKLFSVKDRGLIMVSISAIQEQYALIMALTARVTALEKAQPTK